MKQYILNYYFADRDEPAKTAIISVPVESISDKRAFIDNSYRIDEFESKQENANFIYIGAYAKQI